VLLSAHGEREQPERFVTAREAHILLAATVLMAGIALRRVRRFRWTLVLVSSLAGVWMAHHFVANETSQAPFALSYQAARYLDEHVGGGEQVIVLAQGLPEDLLARYLDRAEQAGGSAARNKALGVLLDLDNSPPNYQRILVHSRLGKQQLRSIASLPASLVPRRDAVEQTPAPAPCWVVVWSDFSPTNELEASLRERVETKQPLQLLEKDGLRVAIYRLG
jgi:hypothetical protein